MTSTTSSSPREQTDAPSDPQKGSGQMFDAIARRYDMINRVLSLGLDQGWRRALVKALELDDAPRRVLDVATGTGDVAIAIARLHSQTQVIGLDPSEGMLAEGRDKLIPLGLGQRIDLLQGDAQSMSFESDTFDGACISFGIRNVPDRLLGLREMTRVTAPGRKVVVLEFAEPRSGLLAPFARFHIRHVVPRIGAWLSRGPEYRYLQESIEAFPATAEFRKMMRASGLVDVSSRGLGFGAVTLYEGRVPAAAL
jgi:demethylmenaquinone methyltransferase / 2-methoxy-6-polyprenyl-1,4-benzoquinol methylase